MTGTRQHCNIAAGNLFEEVALGGVSEAKPVARVKARRWYCVARVAGAWEQREEFFPGCW